MHPLSIATLRLSGARLLRRGIPASPEAFRLRLLPSGPDLVRTAFFYEVPGKARVYNKGGMRDKGNMKEREKTHKRKAVSSWKLEYLPGNV